MIRIDLKTGLKRCIGILIIVLISISCTDPKLREALKEAGHNRVELEKVLKHYKNNDEKYRAACFLIENMGQYGSYYSKDMKIYNKYFDQLDSVQKFRGKVTDEESDSLLNNFKDYHGDFGVSKIKLVPDLKNIKAKYLIENIDLAFYAWKNIPWTKYLKFNEFCEYILPYRIRNESLSNWREYLLRKYGYIINRLSDSAKPIDVLIKLREEAGSSIALDNTFRVYPFNLSLKNLLKAHRGVCENRVDFMVLSGRAIGIPMAMDYVPQWGNRSGSHVWYVTFSKKGKPINFLVDGIDRYNIEGIEYGISKVFRLTYKMQDDTPLNIEKNKKYLPRVFSRGNFIDVTKDYSKFVTCNDVQISIDNTIQLPEKLAYLCVFNNKGWVPVYWGRIKKHHVKFNDMGSNLVYLPATFKNNTLVPIAPPFILTYKGTTIPLKPDKDSLQTILAHRKYPLKPRIRGYLNRMKGGKFEASNNRDFKDAVVLFKIPDTPKSYYNEIKINDETKYRYIKYVGPSGSYGDVAEIELYSDNGKINGKQIGISGKKDHPISNAFDGKRLTYYEAGKPDHAWIGLDLGIRKKIREIRFLPRNDQNDIEEGFDYELFYWDSGWVSVKRKIAKGDSIVFDRVPKNGLYWIHCYTGGVEERIFTYKDKKIVWW